MQQHEIIIDSFAGGGGASVGIEMALGRSPDVAINHDPEAVQMHMVNHPDTEHHCQNVWQLDPVDVAAGRPVGLAWFSPDCKHFSKAKGGAPVKRNIRDLAWVVVLYAQRVKPRVIMLENVEEFQTWGPLDENGRPCPVNKGVTFRKWVRELKKAGYEVDWRELRACDYGAPTIRKRLFLIARRDGQPIVWPAPTHGDPRLPGFNSSGLRPWRTAADIIDWLLPCPSIFFSKTECRLWFEQTGQRLKRPLAEASERRIFLGYERHVFNNPNPYIVTVNHGGSNFRGQAIDVPFNTVTAARDGHGLVMPYLTKYRKGSSGSDISEPAPTITSNSFKKRPGGNPPLAVVQAKLEPAGDRPELCAAFIAKHFTGVVGTPVDKPAPTTLTKGAQNQLVVAHLMKLRGTCQRGQTVEAPIPSLTAGGTHIAEVRAFLVKYHGSGGQWADARDPMHTVTSKDEFGLVTVHGVEYMLTDIGMRMLTPRELFRAQGFPDTYIIDRGADGDALTKTAQVRMCGNSVCPPIASAIVGANLQPMDVRRAAE